MPEDKKKWEEISNEAFTDQCIPCTVITYKMDVPGGWLYRTIMFPRNGLPPTCTLAYAPLAIAVRQAQG